MTTTSNNPGLFNIIGATFNSALKLLGTVDRSINTVDNLVSVAELNSDHYKQSENLRLGGDLADQQKALERL